jgi:hypothetical protein
MDECDEINSSRPSGYANAPQRNVIPTLTVFLIYHTCALDGENTRNE